MKRPRSFWRSYKPILASKRNGKSLNPLARCPSFQLASPSFGFEFCSLLERDHFNLYLRVTVPIGHPQLPLGYNQTIEAAMKNSPSTPFVMLVFNKVKPGFESEYEDLVAPVLDAMRHEPNFINTVLHRDPEDPSQFMLYETWVDRDNFFQVQMKRDYRRAYEERLPQLLQKPRQMFFWEPRRSDFAFFSVKG